MRYCETKEEKEAWDLGYELKPNPYPVDSDLHKVYMHAKDSREECEWEREWHKRNAHKL